MAALRGGQLLLCRWMDTQRLGWCEACRLRFRMMSNTVSSRSTPLVKYLGVWGSFQANPPFSAGVSAVYLANNKFMQQSQFHVIMSTHAGLQRQGTDRRCQRHWQSQARQHYGHTSFQWTSPKRYNLKQHMLKLIL